ncbi:MAG: HNH endonuclease [Thiotrichales bacterium]|nr:HNH endonuclease [Thiotrichales bacterium]
MLHYDPETGVFTWLVAPGSRNDLIGRTAGCICKTKNGRSYRHIRIHGKLYLAHRLAWLYVTGEWPEGLLDHEDNEGTENPWTNLRLASYSQNIGNSKRRRTNKVGLKGVVPSKTPGNYCAYVHINGATLYLGTFNCPHEAHRAYCAAARSVFGRFARAG